MAFDKKGTLVLNGVSYSGSGSGGGGVSFTPWAYIKDLDLSGSDLVSVPELANYDEFYIHSDTDFDILNQYFIKDVTQRINVGAFSSTTYYCLVLGTIDWTNKTIKKDGYAHAGWSSSCKFKLYGRKISNSISNNNSSSTTTTSGGTVKTLDISGTTNSSGNIKTDLVDANIVVIGITCNTNAICPVQYTAGDGMIGFQFKNRDNWTAAANTVVSAKVYYTDCSNPGTSLGNTYSEEEQVIGTFLGKTLYRKVFRTTESVTSSNKEYTQTDASQIKDIINIHFIVEHSNNAWCISAQGTIQNNHIYAKGESGDTPTSGMYTNIVVEYTKIGE